VGSLAVHDLAVQARFWAKVDKGPHPKGCWLWTANSTSEYKSFTKSGLPRKRNRDYGYGKVTIGGVSRRAHHVSFEITHNRPLRDGMILRHTCDNGKCVNPDHLLEGTNVDNMRDMYERGREPDLSGELNPSSRLSWEFVSRLRSEYEGNLNLTCHGLARKYNLTPPHLWSILTYTSWNPDGRPVGILREARKRISDDDVRRIRKLYDSGMRVYEINPHFSNISKRQVGNIARRKSRVDVND